MFNLKLVLLAIFLILGCVFANVQQGEDNGASLAERTSEDLEATYEEFEVTYDDETEVAFDDEVDVTYESEATNDEVDATYDELAEQREKREVAPRSRGGSPCSPASSSSSSSSSTSSAPTSAPTSTPTSKPASTSGKSASTSGNPATTSGKSASSSTSAKSASTSTSAKSASTSTSGKSATTSGKSSSTTTTGKSSTTGSPVGLCDIVPGAQQPLKLLVPLYVYPGAAWDQVVSAASKAHVIAIINPNSGPAPSGPDSSYNTYMTKLNNAGAEMVGYVYTSYGARSINDVKADIDLYATKYPGVKGIFFDEASADASAIPFYTQAYNYVMSKGMTHSILNPGTQPAQGYVSISTNIVIFEEAGSKISTMNYASWVTCAPNAAEKANYKYKFSGIAHSTASGSVASIINSFHSKGMGLVYVTDGAAGCCTYNALTTYMSSEASSVQSMNN
jgi:hypothetical protein